MLTAHSLCWLCQMPLAIARWDLFAMRVGAAGLRTAMPSVRTAGPVKHAALRTLLAKTAAVAAAGNG